MHGHKPVSYAHVKGRGTDGSMGTVIASIDPSRRIHLIRLSSAHIAHFAPFFAFGAYLPVREIAALYSSKSSLQRSFVPETGSLKPNPATN